MDTERDTERFTTTVTQDGRPRFRRLTVVLFALLILAGVIATFVKLEQDRVRSAAFRELIQMGFTTTIGGTAMSVRFRGNACAQSEIQLHRLPSLLTDCTGPNDLGFSPRLTLEILDLGGSASEEIVTELKDRFPQTKILQWSKMTSLDL